MKLKFIKKCICNLAGKRRTFIINQVKEIDDKEAGWMIEHGYAERYQEAVPFEPKRETKTVAPKVIKEDAKPTKKRGRKKKEH